MESSSNFEAMFSNASLSINNYDSLLIGWSSQQIQNNKTFDGGNSIYCSQEAQIAHDNLVTNLNWTITDGGVCAPYLDIISDHSEGIYENHTEVIKVLVSDPDFDTAVFSISGGADSDLFSIDAITGLLSFINPPDYENPQSSDNNNSYQVEVTATDNGTPQETATQLITIHVYNLDEIDPVNLVVQITADTENINLEESFPITVNISNIGSVNAIDTIIFDILPIGIIHSTWTCNSTGTASCTTSGTGGIYDSVYIPNDGSTITYTVNATATTEFNYQVFVETTEPQYDTGLSNNSASLLFFDEIFENGFETP